MRRLITLVLLILGVGSAQAQEVLVTKVILRSIGPGQGTVAYSVNNFGWTDDMTDVEASLWAQVSGRLVLVDRRKFGFIEKGQYRAADNLRSPILTGKMLTCVSYTWEKRRTDVLDFYSNEGHSNIERQMGVLTKFRASVSDANAGLCRSMPESATRHLH
jgi:hypothetical protein